MRGTAYDSVHHAPVVAATVVAIQADSRGSPSIAQARTDDKGAFEFSALPPGRYTISVESAALDSAGLSIPDVQRTLDPGSVAQLALSTPSRATLVRRVCGAALTDTTLGAIVGVVSDVTTGQPLPHALLVFQWSDFNVDSTARFHTHGKQASVMADSNGVFRACGVPAQRSVFIQAQAGARNTGIIEEQIGESGVLGRDLSLPPDSAARYGAANITVKDADGQPIPGAQVRLVGTTRTVGVESDGRAHVDSLPLGTQQLLVMAVGFYPERRTVAVTRHGEEALTVTMEKLATVLESMRIVASANDPRYREFEQRRKQGWGDFYTAEDIDKRQVFDLSDFFMVLRHVNAHVSSSGHHYFTMLGQGNRGISTILGGTDPMSRLLTRQDTVRSDLERSSPEPSIGRAAACQPAIVVNGVLMAGGDFSGDDLDAIPARFVHAIEVYDDKFSPVPAQYRFPGHCGAILVWTK